jgi:ribosomal protein S18 acetylase RimI-like enzyme
MTPATRPATARPRSDAPPQVDPPSADEVDRVLRHLCSLPEHDGATIAEDEDLGVLISRLDGGGPEHVYAAMPRWAPDQWASLLPTLRRRMAALGAWPSLLLSFELDGAHAPAHMESVLRADGWTPVSTEQVLWVGHASVVPHLDRSLRVEAVQPRTVSDHEALERLAFGLGAERAEERRGRLARALGTGRLRAWVVRVDGAPVAVARLAQGDGVAGLAGIGVHPAWRRRGFGTLVTTVATRAGLALGNRIVWLSVRDGDEAATSLYVKLGFRPLFSWTRWLATERPRG